MFCCDEKEDVEWKKMDLVSPLYILYVMCDQTRLLARRCTPIPVSTGRICRHGVVESTSSDLSRRVWSFRHVRAGGTVRQLDVIRRIILGRRCE